MSNQQNIEKLESSLLRLKSKGKYITMFSVSTIENPIGKPNVFPVIDDDT